MFKEQNGICPICKEPLKEGRYTSIDHDHKTGVDHQWAVGYNIQVVQHNPYASMNGRGDDILGWINPYDPHWYNMIRMMIEAMRDKLECVKGELIKAEKRLKETVMKKNKTKGWDEDWRWWIAFLIYFIIGLALINGHHW